MKDTFIKFLYIVFIGVLTGLFVGVGIDTFYSSPERPEFSTETAPMLKVPAPEEIAAAQAAQAEYQKFFDEYRGNLKNYNANVCVIATIAAVLIAISGLLFLEKLLFMADGLLLGGIFSLFYAIVRGFQSDNSKLRFVAVTIGLAVVLGVGYFRFIRKKRK